MSNPVRDYRLHWVENLSKGLGMTPVSFDLQLARFVEVSPEEAFRLRCPDCPMAFTYDRRDEIVQHMVTEHGKPEAEIVYLANGGWRKDKSC
jgi:hypothetical protein